MRIANFIRAICGAVILAGLASNAQIASAQNAPSWSRTPRSGDQQNQVFQAQRPARTPTARPQPRSHYTPQSQQAQQQGAVQQNTYRPYTSGYYYPSYGYYPYPAPYPYYGPYGDWVSSGGAYYQYQVPNPYAFGSAFTYGYPQPGGYHYYYPW